MVACNPAWVLEEKYKVEEGANGTAKNQKAHCTMSFAKKYVKRTNATHGIEQEFLIVVPTLLR